jgi:hypothetical protein
LPGRLGGRGWPVRSRRVLGPGCPCGAEAALLVGGLSGDSVRHGGSGAGGDGRGQAGVCACMHRRRV